MGPVFPSVSDENNGQGGRGPSVGQGVTNLSPEGTGGMDGGTVDSGGGSGVDGLPPGCDPPGHEGAVTGRTGYKLAIEPPQADLRRQVLNGQHIGNKSSKIPAMDNNNKKGISANVVQRNYALNDIGALKKKLSQESNTEPFSIGKEAKDGSNIWHDLATK